MLFAGLFFFRRSYFLIRLVPHQASSDSPSSGPNQGMQTIFRYIYKDIENTDIIN